MVRQAHHEREIGKTVEMGELDLPSPCASAEERRPCGGPLGPQGAENENSRRGLSEAPQGPSSAAARMVEYRREARRAGAPGVRPRREEQCLPLAAGATP